jgi:ATP-dependent Clp protease ATP-binding subunit ClpA
LENKEFELTWNDSVLDFVASAYEPRYGARMLRGHVDRNIGNILASEILLGNIPARSNIHLDFKNNTLIWAIKPLTTASSTTQPV